MIILGIESSCDETAAAIVKDGRTILASVVSSQIKLHQPFSGVVPELASRAHVSRINSVISQAMGSGRVRLDAIAVTVGPGLIGSLLVGKMTAQTLGWAMNLPVIGVNHIEGHLLSPLLSDKTVAPPFLGLVVSGGHTDLILVKKWGHFRTLGRTRDDAAGEAFDKVAKMMGLGYPGGPIVEKMARWGRGSLCPFPRAWLPGTWDFSFSGLKTAVLYKLRTQQHWTTSQKRDVCAGFQTAVIDVLVGKTIAAAKAHGVKTIVVGGGVIANRVLRDEFLRKTREERFRLSLAPVSLSTDNAAMIAAAAYFKSKHTPKSALHSLRVRSQMGLS